MTILTDAQLATARLSLGTDMDEDDLQDRYDRTGDLDTAVVEVLQQRLADLKAAPAQFSTPDYSQNTQANITALEAQIAKLGVGLGSLAFRVVEPPDRRVR